MLDTETALFVSISSPMHGSSRFVFRYACPQRDDDEVDARQRRKEAERKARAKLDVTLLFDLFDFVVVVVGACSQYMVFVSSKIFRRIRVL